MSPQGTKVIRTIPDRRYTEASRGLAPAHCGRAEFTSRLCGSARMLHTQTAMRKTLRTGTITFALMAFVVTLLTGSHASPQRASSGNSAAGSQVTFNRDIAP